MYINLDERLQLILNMLNEYGEGYLVGGALRDIFLGLKPNDFDMATNIPMEELLHILSEYNPIIISEKYQVISIQVDEYKIEIARFRKENGILDGRNPKEFEFVENIEEDLTRRDFTVNALAYNNKGLIDKYDSLKDIENLELNIIGNDKVLRLSEDNTRIFRALYLVSKYNFKLSNETKKAIASFRNSRKLNVSVNGFGKLLDKILFDKYSYKSLKIMLENNLFKSFIPELTSENLNLETIKNIVNTYNVYCKYNVFEDKTIGYAILFLYSGKKDNDDNKFLVNSMTIAETYLKKLGVNITDIILIKNLIYYSNIINRIINKETVKRMLFEFRNNKNVSKLLNFISFIHHHQDDYNETVKKTLELLSRIQAIYFEGEVVFINDLDINLVDLYNIGLDTEISKESIRQDIYKHVNEGNLANKKEDIIEYIKEKYSIKFNVDKVCSAGGIVYRVNKDNKIEFLLVKILGGNWGFPKGHIEEGETEVMTAIREIKEETNLETTIIDPNIFKRNISYITNMGELKYVTFFLAKAVSHNVLIDLGEISEYKWCSYNDALKIVTYSSQRKLLQEARLYIFND
ncbi:NUDIX domain-containing protein [Streptobacillus canis]|uniref:NUDIX domain-containing protein n=1 Tax=Streptobacillus canis TaxID=2678686 RepID=UPI0012E1B504|nr:NUDIX domain-containing protein [Streptobacillus canis]